MINALTLCVLFCRLDLHSAGFSRPHIEHYHPLSVVMERLLCKSIDYYYYFCLISCDSVERIECTLMN